ncbi:TPA: hypothetical protein DCZ32_02900, partial [Candidatus Uhrbacteria bacterium]|nr:hypothetical protein [Candidatus Uhrbacteria bacterium]
MAFFTRIFWNLAKFFEQSRWSKTAVTAFVIFFGVFAVSGKALARDRALLEKLAGLIAEFNLYIAGFIGGLITIVLEKLLIPIMQYNEFATSPVVAMGWVLVRDIMNMFFIVILLIIAFGTIFGISKIKWQQQVPRLLFVAVLINFSKTITGLLIDFAQVIMMTFVNALKDIAGGNFVDLFQLKDILAFTTRGDVGREQFFSGNVTDSFAIFASSCLAVGLLLAVLAVCLIMLTVFLYRIVTLWVLTIMSPLAFFMLGAKDVVGPASKYYAEWWSKLTAAASIGPILAFFLWLALAAAGQGALAEGFGVPPSESEQTGFITKIFTGNTIMPFVIGIAILLAGLEIAQTTAGSIGGA